ncbi:MAG: inositol monophosphatase [Roseobacter sp.]
MPASDLALVIEAIREAGEIATRFAEAGAARWDKPDGAGPVTEADLAVNAHLEDRLRGARPDYGWLSEESEDSDARLNNDTVFIVDPIDGTRSFVEGSKTWAHSVAIAHKGEITAGVVYLPLRGLLFAAAKGEGAMLNGAPIRVSTEADPDGAAVLATKPTLRAEHWPQGLPQFSHAHRPSLAYRLGLVARARFDAMLTFRPTWEWDVAAGSLIVTEAGGTVTDKTGMAPQFNNASARLDGMIAAGKELHPALLARMQPQMG